MTKVLTGVFERDIAEDLSNRASGSDTLGYPTSAVFEDEKTKQWQLNIYLETSQPDDVLIQELGEHARNLVKSVLPDNIDWVQEGLKDLKPVEVGRFLVHGSHDRAAVRPHHHAIEINANQAFGTGHHGTTAGCLEAIGLVTKRHRFDGLLDLGTGSGILAIALAKQTGMPLLATDIDPLSTKTAAENARSNGIAPLVRFQTASGFAHPVFSEEGPFGLVVANILAGPLRALAHPMTRHLTRNATIVLSGLLIHQERAVLAAYRQQNAFLLKRIHREGWSTLVLRRP